MFIGHLLCYSYKVPTGINSSGRTTCWISPSKGLFLVLNKTLSVLESLSNSFCSGHFFFDLTGLWFLHNITLTVFMFHIEILLSTVRTRQDTALYRIWTMVGSDIQCSIVTRTDEEMRNKDLSSRDSNSGSSDWQASALPTELFSRP